VNKGCTGEKNANSLLTDIEVCEIRKLWRGGKRMGGLSTDELARTYNVTVGCISNIIYRKTWKHLPDPLFAVEDEDV
jgi:hypothetical protein